MDSFSSALHDLLLVSISAYAAAMTLLWLRVRLENRQLKQEVRVDPLTGLLRKHAFDTELRLAVARAVRVKAPLAVVYFDGNRFRDVNSRYGHETGNRLIAYYARVLQDAFSRVTDRIGRLGGDEFGVILTDAYPTGVQVALGRFLWEACRASMPTAAGPNIPVSLSAGAAGLIVETDGFRIGPRRFSVDQARTKDGVELIADALIKEADRCMYIAKEQAKVSNCAAVLDGEIVEPPTDGSITLPAPAL